MVHSNLLMEKEMKFCLNKSNKNLVSTRKQNAVWRWPIYFLKNAKYSGMAVESFLHIQIAEKRLPLIDSRKRHMSLPNVCAEILTNVMRVKGRAFWLKLLD